MSDTPDTDPLEEWNRINKENAEQGFASALYSSLTHTSPIIDRFSLWLLAGSGASGALLIAQIENVLPYLTAKGFKVCMFFLIVSAILGFLAKYKALRCQIQVEMQSKLLELLAPIFAEHEQAEEQIQQYAEQRGMELDTELSFGKVVEEFSKPFPRWVKWLIKRQVSKNKGGRQAGHHIAIKAYVGQLRFTFWQAVMFIAFLSAGAWYAQAI